MTDFFSGKNVVITGANGFVGSWLTERLVERGAKVRALIRKDSVVGLRSIGHMESRPRVVYGDVRDAEVAKKLVAGSDIIFHLAAVTQVLYASRNPVEAYEINAYGTLNLLEALRASKSDPFLVYMSTDKVYGEPKYLPIDEDHQLAGKSPYDASKLAADRLVYAYYNTYGLKSSIVRCSNIIGGRDSNFLRIVPDIVSAVLNNSRPVIRGDGTQIRDYMHVHDAVSGLVAVAEKQRKSNGEAFNIGTETPTSVISITNRIISIMGKQGIKPRIMNRNSAEEIDRQYLSYKKAARVLNWRPRYKLMEGLEDAIKWYAKNLWWQKVISDVRAHYVKN